MDDEVRSWDLRYATVHAAHRSDPTNTYGCVEIGRRGQKKMGEMGKKWARKRRRALVEAERG
jgi:hypothetical protein